MSPPSWRRRPNLSLSDWRRQIGDVADHPRDAHARRWRPARPVVMPVLPVRIGRDRVARDGVPGHTLWQERVGARDRNDRIHLVGVRHRPFERLHPPERAAGHGRQTRDAEHLQKGALRPHHVRDGDDRKVRSVRPAGRRVDGRRPRRAAASSQQIRADDEELVGVEGLAGTDHAVPPAEAAALAGIALLGAKPVSRARHHGPGREAGGVRVPAERVAHEDDVVASRREPAVGLVGDAHRLQMPAAVERQGRGRSRNCVSTVPTEPAAAFGVDVAMRAIICLRHAQHRCLRQAPHMPPMYDPELPRHMSAACRAVARHSQASEGGRLSAQQGSSAWRSRM